MILASIGMISALAVAVVSLPYGWHAADGVHRMAMTDWEKHLVMASGVAASTDFPPPHPYIQSVDGVSYHFGYQLLAAAIHVGGGRAVDLFPILLAITLLTAAAAPFVVYVLARDLCRPREALLAAAGSTLLIGFDLVVMIVEGVRAAIRAWPPAAGLAGLRAVVPSTHVDFWMHNIDRSFSAPFVATMWAPHNVAAALLALLAIHLVSSSDVRPGRPAGGWVLSGMLIAALPALSAYVALVLAVGVVAAALVESATRRCMPYRTEVWQRWLAPGLVALILAVPTFPTLTAGSSSGLTLALSESGSWSNGAIFNWLFGSSVWTNLLDTPALLLFEFGAIGVLGVWAVGRLAREGKLGPARRQAAAMIVAVLLFATVVRPPVGIGNNLYARGLLLVWFLLAPFAAIAAARWASGRLLLVGVLICALGSGYAVVGYVLEGVLFWGVSPELVTTMRWINEHRSPDSVVALDPEDENHGRVGYWLRRPTVLTNPRLARLFGATDDQVARVDAALDRAFAAADPEMAARRFEALGADTIALRPGVTPTGTLSSADLPVWVRPPCFEVLRRGPEWAVIALRTGICDGR